MNSVDMKDPNIPMHWKRGAQKLSEGHVTDVKNIISMEHSLLYQFYGNVDLGDILNQVYESDISTAIIAIINMLPFFSNIRLQQNRPRNLG